MANPLNLVGFSMRQLHVATSNDADCIQWLRAHGLLANNVTCACGNGMRESGYSRATNDNQKIWRCPVCRSVKSIRKGSFFDRSCLKLPILLDIIYWWSLEARNVVVESQLSLDDKTVTDWFNFLRDICSDNLLRNPVVLGGPGRVVAIDESVVARRKPGNAQGRPVKEQWVFGGVDLTTKEFFMELVPRRNAATLIPIIQRNVVPGTMIWSDEWAAYNGLPAAGYPHQTVNHSQFFVDPVTGCQTNNIEARWNSCKAKFKARFGVPRKYLPSYLDEYLWRSRRSNEAVFNDIVEAIKVFTVEEMMPHVQHLPGLHAKNLLLRDKKKKGLWLVTARHNAEINLADLAKRLGAPGGLRMADESVLESTLGVRRGCVTPFALINDESSAVCCVVDSQLLDHQYQRVYFHPLVNSATTGLSPSDFKRFLEAVNHKPVVLDFNNITS